MRYSFVQRSSLPRILIQLSLFQSLQSRLSFVGADLVTWHHLEEDPEAAASNGLTCDVAANLAREGSERKSPHGRETV